MSRSSSSNREKRLAKRRAREAQRRERQQSKAALLPSGAWAEEPSEVAARVTDLIARLGALGVSVNPSCRLYEYAATMDDASTRKSLGSAIEARRFATAHLESGLLCDAFDALDGPNSVPGWLGHFSAAINGGYFAGEGNDSSRTKLLELVLAAKARNAGLPFTFEEPDIRVEFQGVRYGFAAKRLKSLTTLRKRIEEAARQISNQQFQGIIVVDLTLALGLHENVFVVPHALQQAEVRANVGKMMRDLSANGEFERWIGNSSAGGRVVGLSVLGCATSFDVSTGRLTTMRRWLSGIMPWFEGTAAGDFYVEWDRRQAGHRI